MKALPGRARLGSAVLATGDRLSGQGMFARLRFLERAQWWERERLHAERDRLLRDTIAVAYRDVPMYRELFDAAGVTLSDVRSAADLPKLPQLTKEVLRAHLPHGAARRTGRRTYEACSSGSTGRPLCLREDLVTAGRYRAAFLLAARWSGWRVGERHLLFGVNPGRGQGRRLKDALLRCTYVSAYDLTDAALDRALARLEDGGIAHVWGYPAALYLLARRAAQQGWNAPLAAAVTWGDTLFPHFRRTIESAFQTTVFDTYGCAEGIQVAAQCGHGPGYHVHSLDTIVEYVDDRGRPVRAGERGALLLTRLHAGATPLIRYRVGDLGRPSGDAVCPCGRGLDLMAAVYGRETDVVVTPSGNRLIVHFFTGILEYFAEIASFQVVQDEPESILLRLVPGPGFTPEIPARVVSELRSHGATGIDIDVELVDDIPPTPGGKRRFIVSALPNPVGTIDAATEPALEG